MQTSIRQIKCISILLSSINSAKRLRFKCSLITFLFYLVRLIEIVFPFFKEFCKISILLSSINRYLIEAIKNVALTFLFYLVRLIA